MINNFSGVDTAVLLEKVRDLHKRAGEKGYIGCERYVLGDILTDIDSMDMELSSNVLEKPAEIHIFMNGTEHQKRRIEYRREQGQKCIGIIKWSEEGNGFGNYEPILEEMELKKKEKSCLTHPFWLQPLVKLTLILRP